MRRRASDMLRDIAEPWFRRTGPDLPAEVASAIYQIIALIWNVSRLVGDADHARRLSEVENVVRRALPQLSAAQAHELVHEIHDRAVERYPNEARTIVGTEVRSLPGGKLQLNVASARFE